MVDKHPDRKIGVVTFDTVVDIIGDGTKNVI